MALPAGAAFTNNSGSTQALATNNASFTVELGVMVVTDVDDFVVGSSGGNISFARWNADVFTADHSSQGVLKGMGIGNYCGVACRVQNGGGGSAYLFLTNGTDNYFNRYNAGVETQVGTQPVATFSNNDVIRLEVTGVGATVTLKIFRALAASPTSFTLIATNTDTTGSRITTAGAPGPGAYSDNSSNHCGIDDWIGDNVAGGGGSSIAAISRYQAMMRSNS